MSLLAHQSYSTTPCAEIIRLRLEEMSLVEGRLRREEGTG